MNVDQGKIVEILLRQNYVTAEDIKKAIASQGFAMGYIGLEYEVLLNDKNILSLNIHEHFMGAYPTITTKLVSFDVKNGQILVEENLYKNKESRNIVIELLKNKIKERAKEKAQEVEKENPEENHFIEILKAEPNTDNLQFLVSSEGISYYHTFDFPHVAKALEPNSEYLLTWQEIDSFVNKKGVLKDFYAN